MKFCEIPHFILDEFYTTYTLPSSGAGTILTLNNNIVMNGGYWTDLWVKTDNEFKKVLFSYNTHDDNYFYFTKKIGEPDFDYDDEVYFRSDSFLINWIKNTKTEYKDYVNTEKTFDYFGRIYKWGNTANQYQIYFYGMKDYAYELLPPHQQTTKIKELFYLWFDKIYSKLYFKNLDLMRLLDPKIGNEDYIGNLANFYNFNIDVFTSWSITQKREFVDSLIYLLKRVGTYSAYYTIFRLIIGFTSDFLNIYERWHLSNLGDYISNPTIGYTGTEQLWTYNYYYDVIKHNLNEKWPDIFWYELNNERYFHPFDIKVIDENNLKFSIFNNEIDQIEVVYLDNFITFDIFDYSTFNGAISTSASSILEPDGDLYYAEFNLTTLFGSDGDYPHVRTFTIWDYETQMIIRPYSASYYLSGSDYYIKIYFNQDKRYKITFTDRTTQTLKLVSSWSSTSDGRYFNDVNHGIDEKYPYVFCYDSNDEVFYPDIELIDNNNIRIIVDDNSLNLSVVVF